VRLAAKLVGWRIDIKSEEEKRQEVEAEMARMARIVDELRSLEGVGEKTIQKLIDSGVAGLTHLLEMTDEELTSIEGIGPKTAEKIREAATVAKVQWDERDAAAEAERQAAQQAAEEESRRLAEEQAAQEQPAQVQAAQEAAAEEPPGSETPAATGPEPEVAPTGERAGQGGESDGQR
jgi:N utilization substance protein A